MSLATSLDPASLRVGGTEVNYFHICRTKLWLFSHGMEMERTSDRVDLGRVMHEESYTRARHKELLIDDLLRIDFDEASGVIHEMKLSKVFEDAHRYQLLYYLYYLKQKGVEGLTGEINYPRQKRTQKVNLTPELETEIAAMVIEIQAIKRSDTPPAPLRAGHCKKCSYEEFCWA